MIRRLTTLLVLGALAGGCARSASELEMRPADRPKQTLRQAFTSAYIARDGMGDWEIVATTLPRPRSAAKSGVLRPLADPPLRQVLHIRVKWWPMIWRVKDNPAGTNATITWYVMPSDDPDEPMLMVYQGAGLVTVEAYDETSVRLAIRDATLAPGRRVGKVSDPLGTFRLRGSLKARRDAAGVRSLLASVDADWAR